MRILPSGTTALLVELDDLEEVLALYAALSDRQPDGVVDLVPAGSTILVVIDPATTTLAQTRDAVLATEPRPDLAHRTGDPVEIRVHYDGEDLAELSKLLGCEPAELVERHTSEEWTVAFCGFVPGFGYLVGSHHTWDVPRRSSPRTKVPAGSVALAGAYAGVYPRSSPGGWQLIGRTDDAVFDLDRDPPALLQPGTSVRFVDARGGR